MSSPISGKSTTSLTHVYTPSAVDIAIAAVVSAVAIAIAAACHGPLAASAASLQLKQCQGPCEAFQAFSSLLLAGSRGHRGLY